MRPCVTGSNARGLRRWLPHASTARPSSSHRGSDAHDGAITSSDRSSSGASSSGSSARSLHTFAGSSEAGGSSTPLKGAPVEQVPHLSSSSYAEYGLDSQLLPPLDLEALKAALMKVGRSALRLTCEQRSACAEGTHRVPTWRLPLTGCPAGDALCCVRCAHTEPYT